MEGMRVENKRGRRRMRIGGLERGGSRARGWIKREKAKQEDEDEGEQVCATFCPQATTNMKNTFPR